MFFRLLWNFHFFVFFSEFRSLRISGSSVFRKFLVTSRSRLSLFPALPLPGSPFSLLPSPFSRFLVFPVLSPSSPPGSPDLPVLGSLPSGFPVPGVPFGAVSALLSGLSGFWFFSGFFRIPVLLVLTPPSSFPVNLRNRLRKGENKKAPTAAVVRRKPPLRHIFSSSTILSQSTAACTRCSGAAFPRWLRASSGPRFRRSCR